MKLHSYIAAKGLTDQQFAEAAKLHKSNVSRFRNGHRRPGWDAMIRIMRATDGEVTPNDFLSEEEAQLPQSPNTRAPEGAPNTGSAF